MGIGEEIKGKRTGGVEEETETIREKREKDRKEVR